MRWMFGTTDTNVTTEKTILEVGAWDLKETAHSKDREKKGEQILAER